MMKAKMLNIPSVHDRYEEAKHKKLMGEFDASDLACAIGHRVFWRVKRADRGEMYKG
jgi:hypothetical protein